MKAIDASIVLKDYVSKEKQTLSKAIMLIEYHKCLGTEMGNLGLTQKNILKKVITHISKSISLNLEGKTTIALIDMLTISIERHQDQPWLKKSAQNYLNSLEAMNMILTVFSDVSFKMEPYLSSALLKFGIA